MHFSAQHRSARAGIEAVSLRSDRTFSKHTHDQFGIGVIRFGAHRSWSGVGTVEAGPGAVITVNPGEMHDGASLDGEVRSWNMLYFDPVFVSEELKDEACENFEITKPAFTNPIISSLFTALSGAVTSPTPNQLLIDESFARFFMILLERYGALRPSRSSAMSGIARAFERLNDDPAANASLQELADLSGVSRFKFLRTFSRQLGITPHAYQLQLRVQLARRMLHAGVAPAAVAVEAGFADQSHLTRAFARQMGVTPAQYRAAVL